MATLDQVTQAAQVAAQAASTAATVAATLNTSVVNVFGYNLNIASLTLVLGVLAIVYFIYRTQKSEKLDFADMLTADGRKVSTSKILQLLGGLSSTWFILKTGLAGTLSPEIFGIYLVYVGGVEGFSKFMMAKYNYSETSVKDAAAVPPPGPNNGGEDVGPIKETTKATLDANGNVISVDKTTEKGTS